MALVGALRVTLGANTANYEAGMRRAQRTAQQTGRGISQSLASAQRSAVGSFRLIGIAAAGFGVGAALRGITGLIDASKQMEAQLRLATRESGNFAQAQADVRRIATETRSGLEETAQLYATINRNSRELGITQAQAARATESISQAFQISGASAAETAGAMRQLLQSIQSGTLRGDEFNSVMEQAPRLSRLVADSLGVQVRQLRSLAEQGRITSRDLLRALTDPRFTASLDDEFRQLPRTFDQAMTQMRNQAIEFFGGFDRGGQFSQAIFAFADSAGDSFDRIAGYGEETGREIRAIMEGLGNVFDPMGEGAHNVFEFIRNEARGLRSAIEDILGTLDSGVDMVNNALVGFGLRSPAMAPSQSNLASSFRSTGMSPFQMIADAQRRAAELRRQGTNAPGGSPLPAAPSGSGARRRTGGGRSSSAERDRERAIREEAQFQSDLRRLRSDLLRAQQDQLTDTVARSQLEEQILDLEREDYAAELQTKVQLHDLTETRAQQLLAAYDSAREERLAAINLERRREIEDENRQISEDQYDARRQTMELEADLIDTARERRAAELRLLDYTYRHERAKLEELTTAEGISRVERERAQAQLNELNAQYAAQRAGVVRSTMGPLESFLDKLPTTAERANEALQRVAAEGLQSIEDGLVAALSGTKSLAEAFRDMASSIIADLLRIQIQRMITIPLANALSGLSLFGGGGGAGMTAAGFGKFFDAALASGGVPGFAHGGSMVLGGRAGVDRNFLSLNGLPIARVSRGEPIDIGRRAANDGGNTYIIHSTAPNSGDPRRDRRSSIQHAAILRDEIARAAKTGH